MKIVWTTFSDEVCLMKKHSNIEICFRSCHKNQNGAFIIDISEFVRTTNPNPKKIFFPKTLLSFAVENK